MHALAQYLDTNSQNAYNGRFYWLIRSDTSNLASISRWEAVTAFRRDLGTVPTGKVFAKRAPVAMTMPSVSAHAYYGNAPRGARRESKAQRLSVVDGRGLIMNGAYGPPSRQHRTRRNTTHDDGEYCMVWSTSTTKTALAALTRWEIAKHEMEREALLHYDLAKPRPEPEMIDQRQLSRPRVMRAFVDARDQPHGHLLPGQGTEYD
ncbi:hypothetical protein E4U38_002189 [Claviceps purpurea]|nr:hypothetical protein E4U38_002189 [Claviceps purpurea]